MADRPDGFGLTAEIKGKIDGKYDANLGKTIRFLWRMRYHETAI